MDPKNAKRCLRLQQRKKLFPPYNIQVPTLHRKMKLITVSYWVEKKTSGGIIEIDKPGELQYIVEEEKIFVVGYISDRRECIYLAF